MHWFVPLTTRVSIKPWVMLPRIRWITWVPPDKSCQIGTCSSPPCSTICPVITAILAPLWSCSIVSYLPPISGYFNIIYFVSLNLQYIGPPAKRFATKKWSILKVLINWLESNDPPCWVFTRSHTLDVSEGGTLVLLALGCFIWYERLRGWELSSLSILILPPLIGH